MQLSLNHTKYERILLFQTSPTGRPNKHKHIHAIKIMSQKLGTKFELKLDT